MLRRCTGVVARGAWLMCCLLPVAGVAGTLDELTSSSGEFMNMHHAVHCLAAESSGSRYIIESWYDSFYTNVVADGKRISHESVKNPHAQTLRKPPRNVTGAEALKNVVDQHGGFVLLDDPKLPMVNVVRKELKENPAWPLNLPFKEHADNPMTLAAAKRLLVEKYGMNLRPDAILPGSSVAEGTVVWTAEDSARCGGRPAVRDLVNALASKLVPPGRSVRILPVGDSSVNTAEDEKEVRSRTDFEWSMS